MKLWRIIAILMVSLIGLLTIVEFSSGHAQSGPATITPAPHITPRAYPTTEARQSIFVQDTCAPPCWFGLIAGQSSAEEVAEFVQQANALFIDPPTVWPTISLFDTETGILVHGSYAFSWHNHQRADGQLIYGYLELRDGELDVIRVLVSETVYLDQVLDILGPPNSVRFWRGAYNISYLGLSYEASHLMVVLRGPFGEPCNVAHMYEHFWVDELYYLSPDAWLEYMKRWAIFSLDEDTRLVPPETWQAWLAGDVDADCLDAWEELPHTNTVPHFELPASPTPVPTVTSDPQ